MSIWDGWQAAFLTAAHCPNNSYNRDFLNTWALHADSSCNNNPIDVSHPATGSFNCVTLPGGRHAQNFTSHTSATNAFRDQIAGTNFDHILAMFVSGNPDTYNHKQAVADEVREWGSNQFANYLQDTWVVVGPSTPGQHAPQSFKGWRDLQHAVNVTMPKRLNQSQKARNRALQILTSKRKVGG